MGRFHERSLTDEGGHVLSEASGARVKLQILRRLTDTSSSTGHRASVAKASPTNPAESQMQHVRGHLYEMLLGSSSLPWMSWLSGFFSGVLLMLLPNTEQYFRSTRIARSVVALMDGRTVLKIAGLATGQVAVGLY